MKKISLMITAILLFAVMNVHAQLIASYQYWFDNNFANAVSVNVAEAQEVNINSISAASITAGWHSFNIRALDTNGKYSVPLSSMFAKSDGNIVEIDYWFDNDYSTLSTVSIAPAQIVNMNTVTVPTTSLLGVGIHYCSMRFKDADGNFSVPYTTMFAKSGGNIVSCQYWFDNNFSTATTQSFTPGTVVDMNAALSTASITTSGIHYITIRTEDALGNFSVPETYIFTKSDGNLVEYEYWFDNDFTNRTDVPITPAQQYTMSSINASALSNGSHTVSLHFLDQYGNWSVPLVDTFIFSPCSSSTTVINASGPTTFCSGGSVALSPGNYSSYHWSTGASTQSINVSTSGTYLVTVTGVSGCTGTASKIVTVNQSPTPVISATGTTFCQEGFDTLNTGSFASYSWSTGDTEESINIVATTTETFTVTVSIANGCTGTASQLITVTPNPTPTITGIPSICSGNPTTLDAGSFGSYQWSTGATTEAITASSFGTFTVTVTNGNGCTGIASIDITVNPSPVVSITPNGTTTFCDGGNVTLDAGTFVSYHWNTGETTESIIVSSSDSYTVTVTDGNGCTGTAAQIVTVNSNPAPVIIPSGPTTFCNGGNVTLDAGIFSSYNWNTGETTEFINVTTSGTFVVTVSDNNNCIGNASVNVSVLAIPAPVITANGSTTICQGSSVSLDAGSFTFYNWSTGDESESITVSTSGTYSVTVSNAGNCTGTATQVVTVNPLPTAPNITPNGPTTFCLGGSVSLDAGVYDTYSWSNGPITEISSVSTSGTFTVTVADANSCTATASLIVAVNQNPTPIITPDGPTTFCDGGSVTLDAGIFNSYNWNTNEVSESITVSTSGTDCVTVTDNNGCTGTACIDIVNIPSCNGTPSNGVASIDIVTSCGTGQSGNLNLSGGSVCGVTFSWQSSLDNSNWNDISGATTVPYSTSPITASTYFRCVTTCTATGLTANSNPVYVLYFPNCYCTPIYTNPCDNSGIYIDNFSTTAADSNITNNNSGCNGATGNYIMYNLSMTVRQGSSFNVNMQSGNGQAEGFGIWIDYNQNGSFDDPGEFVYASPDFSGNVSNVQLTIPVHANTGTTVMRVRSHLNNTMTSDQSCTALDDGETEDYLVNITVAPILPDLQISSVSIPDTNLVVTDSFHYQVSVFNGGLATAPSGVRVRGYLSLTNVIDFSSIVISEDTIAGPIPVNQTSQIAKTILVPFNIGQYNLIYKVNPLYTFSELNYANNTSQPVIVTIIPGYSATATVSQPYYLQGTTIPITGTATKIDNTPAANVVVEVYVITNSLRRTILVTTDSAGNYSTNFVPLSKESGHYIVGASFPGIGATAEQDNFDILGVLVNGGTIPQFQFAIGDTLTGTLTVDNLSNTALSDFTLTPITLPNGAVIGFDTVSVFDGGATINLGYSISGTALTPGNNFLTVPLNAQADEGIIQPTFLYYYCQAQQGFISANISLININVSTIDTVQIVTFYLSNRGQASSGNVQINLPQVDWLNSVTQNPLPAIAPGDSAQVMLRFIGMSDVPIGFPITGTIGFSAQNGNGFSLPFTFQKVSDTVGTVIVNAVDEYTFFTTGAPRVAGASVTISNLYTGVVYAQGLTDSNGVFQATGLPEGTHHIVVTKEKHQSYDDVITVNPGGVATATAFLNYQAITFSWNVVPTTVQDTYNITLVMTFETNVPEPVVTIGMPDTLPQLFGSDVFNFNVTLTNHGLITANNLIFNMPNDDPDYEFVTNYVPADLPALSSIQVPVQMQRRPSTPSQLPEHATIKSISKLLGIQAPSAASAINCCVLDFVIGSYTFVCDGNNIAIVPTVQFIIGGRTGCDCGSSSVNNLSNINLGGNGGPGLGTGDGGPGGTSSGVSTTGTNSNTNCNPCLVGLGLTLAGCVLPPGLSVPLGLAQCFACSGNTLDLIQCRIFSCGGAIPGTIGCLFSIGGSINCFIGQLNTPSALTPSALNSSPSSNLGATFSQLADNLLVVDSASKAYDNMLVEYFGNMVHDDDWVDIRGVLEPYISANNSIDSVGQSSILDSLAGFQISPDTLLAFIPRWNSTVQARNDSVFAPNIQFPNIINGNVVDSDMAIISRAFHYSDSLGFSSLFNLRDSSLATLNSLVNSQKNSVCASVTIQLNQQLTMTREAFDGTLSIFNGHPTDSMRNLTVNIQITGPNGVPSDSLFEIDTTSLINLGDITGTGALASQQTGSVAFRFIPDSAAAPQVPVVYNFGGSISYFDPFSQAMVTMPLSPVPLTVNPSPSLMLHYFMQRNILGDDPLTAAIEPSIPAELGVMIENKGYGDAVNLTLSSSQPEIVDNEKGLAVNFSLIGSKLQGKPAILGLTNIPFGIIPALQTRIGEWYFTSSLLGKFVDFSATVTHNNSSGHPGLSLVQGVQLHELTHPIKVYGALDDTINDFLVNDFHNADEIPDHIYLSQGTDIFRVFPASSGSFSSPVSQPTFTNTLTVTAADTGWNFIRLDDPGAGLYDIVSITRQDAQVIPLDNAWLTYVTLPLNHDPIYENKFQFVDTFPSLTPVNYTVVWTPKDLNVPAVDTIIGAPTQVAVTPVQHLTVVFSKPIDSTTFTYDDLTLVLQGGPNIMDSTVIITRLDSVTYDLNISSLTAVGNGFYILTVQAAGIQDIFGISGLVGKQTSWSQFINTPAVQAFQGLPNGNIDSSFRTIQILFNLAIDETTVTPQRFSIYKDSVLQSGSLNIDSFSTDKKLFYLSGLENILTQDGQYELVVDLPNIQSVSHVFGVQTQSVTLTLDRMGPFVVNLSTSNTGGIDSQHVTFVNIQFDSDVFGFNTSSVQLTRNGTPLSLNITQLTWTTPFSLWTAGNFGFLTYPDGNYVFSVFTTGIKDAVGNYGTDTQSVAWTVQRSSALAITSSSVPATCNSTSDGIAKVTVTGGQLPYLILWNNAIVNDSIIVSAGTYTVSVTDAAGNSATASVTVTSPPPVSTTISAIGLTTFCEGGSVTLDAGTFSNYSWSNGASTQTIIATNNGTYTTTFTDANGCTGTASQAIIVNANPIPTITPSGATTFCDGGSVTLDAGAFSDYSWSNGASIQTINVIATGTFTTTVTDGNGCTGTASQAIVVNANPIPSIAASGSTTFCSGSSVTLDAGSFSNYFWSNGASSQTITATNSGTYTTTVMDANGCTGTASQTVIVNANPNPIITPSGPISFCSGGSVVLDPGTFANYSWNNNSTTETINVSSGGNYSVTVTDANGCSAAASLGITVNIPPTPNINANGPTSFCDGNSVGLDAGNYASFLWNTGSTNETITASGSQPYCVTVTDGNGCTGNGCLNVTVFSNPAPTITPNGPTTFCSGGSVILNTGTFTNYNWSNGATTASIIATAIGNYTVTVSNIQGCTGTTSQIVTVNFINTPVITANGSTNICSGGSVTLDAGSYSSYHWNTGATAETITVNTANTYKVTVSTAQGCTGISAGVIVTVSPTITGLTITGATSVCTGVNVTLSTGTTYNSYIWSTGATTQSIPIITTGIYYVTVSNGGSCTASAHKTVTFQINPTPDVISTNLSNICGGGNANLNVSSVYSAYNWNTGATTQGIVINAGGTYVVTVLATNGCTGTGSLTASSNCILPTNFATTNIAATGGMANWVEPGCYYGYTLRISVHNANNWTSHTITPNTHFMFSGLTHNTQYDWQIETICNASGTINSGWSATQTFTTLARLADGEVDSSFQAFNVFPNPTNNLVTVEFYYDKETIYNLHLTDVTGRIIINIDHNSIVGVNQYEMDLSTLAKGIYLIILNNGEEVLQSKIVVQ